MTASPLQPYWDELGATLAYEGYIRGTGLTAIVGDSISHYAGRCWPSLGGQPYITLAFPGATSQQLMDNLSAWEACLLRDTAPRRAILLVGTNDALALLAAGAPFDPAMGTAFLDTLGEIIPLLRSRMPDPSQIALATMPPMELGRSVDAAAALPYVRGLNAVVVAGAAAEDMDVLDLYAALAGPAGFAPAGSTIDGIHPTAPTYDTIIKPLYDAQIARWVTP